MSFSKLGLSTHLLKAVADQGYKIPTPIQSKAIPVVIEGKDIMAAAQTGTGKTGAFTLPILEQLSKGEQAQSNMVRALIITPTRELAAQIGESVTTYSKYMSIRSTVVFGGININPQMKRLRQGVDVLVATPGRLLDLYKKNAIRFNQVEVLVLDEADRMLDMGFIHDIRKILRLLPIKRQNLMFSATFSDSIRKLGKSLTNNPVEITTSPRNSTVETVEQWVYPVDKNKKSDLLTHLIKNNKWEQVLVFSKTKHGANKLARHLVKAGIYAQAIHGNKSQSVRTKALADFKNGLVQILVATDIASRGLDIDQLPNVVNFDLPYVPEDYIHRIGRTGRAGSVGQAISLVSIDETKQLLDIERLIKKVLTRKLIDGFKPVQNVPEAIPGQHSSRFKKSSKPKNAVQSKKSSKTKSPKKYNSSGQRSGLNSQKRKNKKSSPKSFSYNSHENS